MSCRGGRGLSNNVLRNIVFLFKQKPRELNSPKLAKLSIYLGRLRGRLKGGSPGPTEAHQKSSVFPVAAGPSLAQLANSLNIVVVHRDYPNVLLSDQHLTNFRVEYHKELDRLPTTSWPRFDSIFI